MENTTIQPNDILAKAESLRGTLSTGFRDEIVKSLYSEAETIAKRAVKTALGKKYDFDQKIDQLVTSPIVGLPIMLIVLSFVIWLTVTGANIPSQWIATAMFGFGDWARALFVSWNVPWWITGFIWDGVYLALAWVISVMLPPMAIFFPAFTLLEDLGYLPRVAFNLDWMFKKAGAHGKQSLTMAMGFGCNAAGVIATRVINSPRERLIAILTNNFVPCNGRFPTLIMLATVFVAASFSPALTSLIASGTVIAVVLIGVAFTFLMSWILSKTLLKGEASAFTLELPPYRRPNVTRILYTSLIDRTIFVLWRAMQTAAPAGAIIWISGKHSHGRYKSRTCHFRLAESLWSITWIGWGHSPGLHHCHPRQRDRCADHDDGLYGHGHDGQRTWNQYRHLRPACQRQRLDDADRCELDVILVTTQSLCDDHHDNL